MFKWLLEGDDSAVAFERVYTVRDYYDGPRSGIAEYCGQPHHYCCEWDESKSDYAETFVLVPVDEETLTLAMEQWAIWLEWEAAFHRGEVPQSTHPGLAGTNPRYAELEAGLAARTSGQSTQVKRAHAVFREPCQANLSPCELEVEWTKVASIRHDAIEQPHNAVLAGDPRVRDRDTRR
jgi:hypothetical protein